MTHMPTFRQTQKLCLYVLAFLLCAHAEHAYSTPQRYYTEFTIVDVPDNLSKQADLQHAILQALINLTGTLSNVSNVEYSLHLSNITSSSLQTS